MLAALYAVGFFQGLELHGGYRGNSFKAIHPESFPGDVYVTGSHPTMRSIFYLAARAVGDLWLDDRLHLVLYFALTILALVAVDRIIVLLGIRGKLARLAVISLVMIAHHFRVHFPQLVPSSGTPTALIHPMGLWLLFFLLRGQRVATSLLLSLVMGMTALKNAWYPGLVTLLFAARDRWGFRRW